MSTSATTPPAKPGVPVRLGDKLIQLGLITQDQLRIALMEQKSSGKPLGEAYFDAGLHHRRSHARRAG
jgi:hypothetical protein